MAFNEETQNYDEYPRSQFPGKVDDFVNKQDPTVTMQPILAQYQRAWDNMDISVINSLKESYPDINTYIPSANDFNQMYDGLKATQQFFKDDVQEYVEKIGQYTIGINDSATEEEAATATYSAKKINRLHNKRNISLSASGWTNTFPYSQTVAVEGILATDDIKIVGVYQPADSTLEQIKARNKAAGYLINNDNATSDNAITFLAYKKPATDFTIITEGG